VWCVPVVLTLALLAATPAPDIAQLSGRLADKKWDERSKAFYALLALGARSESKGPGRIRPAMAGPLSKYPQDAENLKTALVKTLEVENRAVRARVSLSED
jgi:hypothetical protein